VSAEDKNYEEGDNVSVMRPGDAHPRRYRKVYINEKCCTKLKAARTGEVVQAVQV